MTAELVWAVVAAAGDGRRLGHERPKAFVKLGDRPLVARAIELLEGHPRVERIVVVVPEGWEEPTALLADELAAGKVVASVPGGPTRACRWRRASARSPTPRPPSWCTTPPGRSHPRRSSTGCSTAL